PLRELDISATGFNDEGAHCLKAFPHLELLRIQHAEAISLAGISEIASLSQLVHVALRYLDPVPEGAIEELSRLKQLHTLDLGHSRPISHEDLRVIAGWPTLKVLQLAGTGLDDAALACLSGSSLVSLQIAENDISDRGLLSLVARPSLKSIKISVAEGKLTLEGVKRFQKLRPDCKLISGSMMSAREFMSEIDFDENRLDTSGSE
ncbi:MAG: hypothetical protein K8F91_06130, partial [Candidatus Obscuribacterales bacterium]|nr:hypothetical protein [Candidatus Obscuribacterales bacterium]